MNQFRRAIEYSSDGYKALDVGCGSGGRFIRILEDKGFSVTGLDVSKEMIFLASKNHPKHKFIHQDICTWDANQEFDFIVAWDSIFHIPLSMQRQVVLKLCEILRKGGVLIYTFGNDQGEHTDQWCNDTFYYSSIGINQNIQLLIDSGLSILHLELDQYPEKHVFVIASKL